MYMVVYKCLFFGCWPHKETSQEALVVALGGGVGGSFCLLTINKLTTVEKTLFQSSHHGNHTHNPKVSRRHCSANISSALFPLCLSTCSSQKDESPFFSQNLHSPKLLSYSPSSMTVPSPVRGNTSNFPCDILIFPLSSFRLASSQ